MFLLLIGAAIGLQAQAIPASDSVDLRAITDAYTTFIHLKPIPISGNDSVIVLHVDSPPPGNLLTDFYRQHGLWFNYLVTNGRGFKFAALDSVSPHAGNVAAVGLQREFLRRLVADSEFNALVVPAIAGYLKASGVPVHRSLLESSSRRVLLDTAMKVAARFFYPDILSPQGIMTHVCTVINAVRELPHRNLALEALAFSAIMGDVTSDSSYIEPDFGPARRLMNQLDATGATKEVRLNRAQGMMWAMMARSTRLRELLVREAKRESDILPFQLQAP